MKCGQMFYRRISCKAVIKSKPQRSKRSLDGKGQGSMDIPQTNICIVRWIAIHRQRPCGAVMSKAADKEQQYTTRGARDAIRLSSRAPNSYSRAFPP